MISQARCGHLLRTMAELWRCVRGQVLILELREEVADDIYYSKGGNGEFLSEQKSRAQFEEEDVREDEETGMVLISIVLI